MSTDVGFRCRCGKVMGHARGVSPANTNRAVCYCGDCQAFAHAIGRADLLDAGAGSDIVQLPPALLTLEQGGEHVACIRLSPKGLHRFYTTCCNTPLGNLVNDRVPFVGIERHVFGDATDRVFGPSRFSVSEKSAVQPVPKTSPLRMVRELARVAFLLVGWKLRGLASPHPFYEPGAAAPKFPVRVLSRAERDALRPLCGPAASVRPQTA